jgi:hypothetical protein
MNLLNANLQITNVSPTLQPDEWEIESDFLDYTGSFSALDVQIGDRIFNDGTLLGNGIYIYRIEQILPGTNFNTLVCRVKWDRQQQPPLPNGPFEPLAFFESAVCSVIYDTATITSFSAQNLSEPFVNAVRNQETIRISRKTQPATETSPGIVRLDTPATNPNDPIVLTPNSVIQGGNF